MAYQCGRERERYSALLVRRLRPAGNHWLGPRQGTGILIFAVEGSNSAFGLPISNDSPCLVMLKGDMSSLTELRYAGFCCPQNGVLFLREERRFLSSQMGHVVCQTAREPPRAGPWTEVVVHFSCAWWPFVGGGEL